jgi:hypothetical protein
MMRAAARGGPVATAEDPGAAIGVAIGTLETRGVAARRDRQRGLRIVAAGAQDRRAAPVVAS